MVETPVSFFHDPNERQRAILGKAGLSEAAAPRRAAPCLCVLTDQRLYVRGRFFERAQGRRMYATSGERSVSLRDVRATSFDVRHVMWSLVFGCALIGLGILSCLATGFSGLGVFALLFFGLPGSAFLALYYLTRKTYFVVEYEGGAMATLSRWHPEDQLREFQRKISVEKERQAGEARQPG